MLKILYRLFVHFGKLPVYRLYGVTESRFESFIEHVLIPTKKLSLEYNYNNSKFNRNQVKGTQSRRKVRKNEQESTIFLQSHVSAVSTKTVITPKLSKNRTLDTYYEATV